MKSSQDRSARVHVPFSVELLERRTLLATNLAEGVLTVIGTNRPDVIDIAVEQNAVGDTLLSVTMNGVKTSFDASLVDALRIDALGKNDIVSIADDVWVDATITGGRGHDSLDGGAGNDEIHGDQGNDNIDGEAGDDDLYGEHGHDALSGSDGNDYLEGGRGSDECLGGLDDDVVHGGVGTDHLDGGDGHDLLDSDGGSDALEDGLAVDLDVELKAELTGSTSARGHAEIEIEQEENGLEVEFEVEVLGATPNTMFDVTLDGVIVGQITTDEFGNGELNLSHDPDGSAEALLPENFPQAGPGSIVTVGNEAGVILAGTLALDHGSDGSSDGGSDCESDGFSDAASDGDSDQAFDGTDGFSDGASDGDSDASSDDECPVPTP